ncbi:MAG TPA: hypothetical protein G4O08_01395 [Anaerolineae bacterium]|nr:hypothetical protein [Anaerolineae bacterium]
MFCRKFSDWMHRAASGPVTLISLVIFLLFTALALPSQAAQSEAATGDAGSPDMSFYYTAEDLYAFAESYGEAGRQAYIRARFTFDLAWPLVYGFFLTMGISWIFRRAFAADSTWQLANLVPVLGVILDYLENLAAALVMARYPIPTAVVDSLASVFTMLKWIMVGGSFVLLLVGALVWFVRWVMRRRRT